MANPKKIISGLGSFGKRLMATPDEIRRSELMSDSADKALPLVLPRARMTPDFIDQQADRVARQMLGEYVKSGKAGDTKNLAGRSMKESERVKKLNYKLTPTGTVAKETPYAPRKGEVKVAFPGDQTVSNKILEEIEGFPIDSVQEGGAYYGLGQRHLPDPEFWKSTETPAKSVQGKVDRVAELYEPQRVIGSHLAMGPKSNNFAMHFADANLRAVDWSKAQPSKINQFDRLIARGYFDPVAKKKVTFPDWPGLADREEALAAMKENTALRKWFNNRMKTPAVTEPLGLPNGLDIQYAITEPRIRDMEINMTGLMTGELKPGALAEAAGAPHNTYTHRILGEAGGPQEVLTPFVIDFPDAAQHIASTKRPSDFTGTIQKVFPHQLVDDQYLDEFNRYRERIKKLTGQKKGGAVDIEAADARLEAAMNNRMAKGGSVDIEAADARLGAAIDARNVPHMADAGKVVKGATSVFKKLFAPRVQPPSDNVANVRQANFQYPKTIGNQTVAIDKLSGGVRMSDPNEVKRVKALADKIASPEGYISRIIVDQDNNVIEGQHRLEALRQLGVKDVPVYKIEDLADTMPVLKMEEAMRGVGSIHSDHVNQLMQYALEDIAKGGMEGARQLDYGAFQKHYDAALDAAISKPATQYPLAPAGTRYEEYSGNLTYMSPDEFLQKVRPLVLDEESLDNISALKQHIKSGGELDPLHIYATGKEDGRHRAYAAKDLGIQQIPVALHEPDIAKADGGVLHMAKAGKVEKVTKVVEGVGNVFKRLFADAPQAESLKLAQERAALPTSKGGLGLPKSNTPEQRANAMGIKTDAYHGSKQDIIGAFKPGYDDNLAFVTKSPEFANNWIGKGKNQTRVGKKAEEEIKAAEEEFRKLKYEKMDYESLNEMKGEPFHAEYDKRNDAFKKEFQETIGVFPDKTHNTVYPLKVQANNTFNPETDMDVMAEFFEKNNIPKSNQDLYAGGNYMMYETKPVVEYLKSKGYDSMRLRESTGDDYPTIAVFNPETTRSRFAAFDPFRRDAAIAALMGVAAPDLLAVEPEKKAGGGITQMAKAGKVVKGLSKIGNRLMADNSLPALEREANLQKFLEPSKTPMRLYHGTTATEGGKGTEAIRRLKPSKDGALGSGTYLTPSTANASGYSGSPNDEAIAAMMGNKYQADTGIAFLRNQQTGNILPGQEGGNMLPVYAQIRNPLVLNGEQADPMVEALIKLGMDKDKALRVVERAYDDKGYIGKEVESRARAAGYDGLMQYREGELSEVVSYNPNAVKSAIGNQGTYDIYNPDLNKASGGITQMANAGRVKKDESDAPTQEEIDAATLPVRMNPKLAAQGQKYARPSNGFLRDPQSYKDMIGNLVEMISPPVPTPEEARAGLGSMRADSQLKGSVMQGYPDAQGLLADQAYDKMGNIAMAGMNVYHGTPHRFPPTKNNPLGEFDPMKIGTGEGAQAYGAGAGYLAEAKDVAKGYQPRDIANEEGLLKLYSAAEKRGDYSAMEVLENAMLHKSPNELRGIHGNAGEKVIRQIEKIPRTVGSLYKVDLPDEQIAKMLDWDKPLSGQPDGVRKALLKQFSEDKLLDIEKMYGGPHSGFGNAFHEFVQSEIVKGGAKAQQQASTYLKRLGIPGIRYLDQGSHAGGAGTSNFVVFDPKNMNILEREKNGGMVAKKANGGVAHMAGGGARGKAFSGIGKGFKRLLSDRFGQGNEPRKGSEIFIGEKANTWDAASAGRAVEMEKAGANPIDIWKQTGTYRSHDGKLRQEISDVGSKFRTKDDLIELAKSMMNKEAGIKQSIADSKVHPDLFPKQLATAQKDLRKEAKTIKAERTKLYGPESAKSPNFENTGTSAKYVLDHPELYNAYPPLGDVIVTQGGSGSGSGALMGQYPDLDMRVTRSGLAGDARGTAIHEMQHGVQSAEDFSPGGNTAMAFNYPEAHEILKAKRKQAMTPMSYEDFVQGGSFVGDATENYNKYKKNLPTLAKSMDQEFQRQSAYEYYKRVAGEVEARTADARRNLSPSERRANFPLDYSELGSDVLPEDIIVKDAKKFASGGSVALWRNPNNLGDGGLIKIVREGQHFQYGGVSSPEDVISTSREMESRIKRNAPELLSDIKKGGSDFLKRFESPEAREQFAKIATLQSIGGFRDLLDLGADFIVDPLKSITIDKVLTKKNPSVMGGDRVPYFGSVAEAMRNDKGQIIGGSEDLIRRGQESGLLYGKTYDNILDENGQPMQSGRFGLGEIAGGLGLFFLPTKLAKKTIKNTPKAKKDNQYKDANPALEASNQRSGGLTAMAR